MNSEPQCGQSSSKGRWQTFCDGRLRLCARGHDRAINRSKNASGVFEEHAPLRKQGHAARRAFEELRSDLVLERADLPTYRRLGDVETLGCAPHVALLGHGDEVTNLRKAHIRDRAGGRERDQDAATR